MSGVGKKVQGVLSAGGYVRMPFRRNSDSVVGSAATCVSSCVSSSQSASLVLV